MKRLNPIVDFITILATLSFVIIIIVIKIDNENSYNYKEKVAEKNATHWVRIFEETFETIEGQEKYWPKKVFSEKNLSALELTESNGNPFAVGHHGEIGLRQTKPIVIKDLGKYCQILRNKGVIKYPNWINSRLTPLVVEKIQKKLSGNQKLSRLVSNLYLSKLFYLHKIGNKSYQKRKYQKSFEYLAAAYNVGPGDLYSGVWPSEYIKKIRLAKK